MKIPQGLAWKIPVFCLCGLFLLVCVVLKLPCPLREGLGIPCPGCGMSRAWLAALQLDFVQAFRMHPMFWSVPVLGIFVLYDCKLFKSSRVNLAVMLVLLFGIGVCYAYRLITYFQGNLAI